MKISPYTLSLPLNKRQDKIGLATWEGRRPGGVARLYLSHLTTYLPYHPPYHHYLCSCRAWLLPFTFAPPGVETPHRGSRPASFWYLVIGVVLHAATALPTPTLPNTPVPLPAGAVWHPFHAGAWRTGAHMAHQCAYTRHVRDTTRGAALACQRNLCHAILPAVPSCSLRCGAMLEVHSAAPVRILSLPSLPVEHCHR